MHVVPRALDWQCIVQASGRARGESGGGGQREEKRGEKREKEEGGKSRVRTACLG